MAAVSARALYAATVPALPGRPGPLTGYLASLAMIVGAGLAAFVVDHVVDAPSLALVFVLPVVAAAATYGWGPSLVAAVGGVAILDFFFIEPRLTFVVASQTDLWTMGLLLVVGAFVSSVAAQSRRRAIVARRAADQAEALHGLARAVIDRAPGRDLMLAAQSALQRMFNAPAVVLASPGEPLPPPDQAAARWVLENGKATHAGAYPFEDAGYDFWPAAMAGGERLVIGVQFSERPDEDPAVAVDLVRAYLAESRA